MPTQFCFKRCGVTFSCRQVCQVHVYIQILRTLSSDIDITLASLTNVMTAAEKDETADMQLHELSSDSKPSQ